jgi:hypothetical protein
VNLLVYSAVWRLAGVAILSGGCGSMAEPSAGPPRLAGDAERLEDVVARGCLPYLLGQKAEQDAMRAVRLNHIYPLPIGLDPGETAPYWTSGFAQKLLVRTGKGVCNTVLRGRDVAAYRDAAQRAVDLTLTPGGSDDGRSQYRQWVPGQITGCRGDIRYSYYEDERRGYFSVELATVACAHDPLRQAP